MISAYVHNVIEAYRELWSEKKKLPWDDIWGCLIEYCNDVVRCEKFWSEENARDRAAFVANRYWIVSSIARLIEDGVKSDDNAFHPRYLGNAEGIVKVLLDREKGDLFDLGCDAVSVAINSPRGRSLEALVNITLRKCRIADREDAKKHSDVWKQFQPYYDSELRRIDIPEYEFVTLVANYLPNYLYMSQEWTLRNLESIFDKSNELWWNCAMQGYSYVGTVYKEVFNFLKERGHLLSALDDNFLNERIKDGLFRASVLHIFRTLRICRIKNR